MRYLMSLLLFLGMLGVSSADFEPTKEPTHNGTRATVDLPTSQQMKNVGGSDGAGLCVFTSLQHAARWQNIVDLEGYREWMRKRPGGGYPDKVDKTLAAYCREKGVPVPKYVQHTGGDIEFLELALKTGRCPCVTYAGSDDFYRYGIDHMVNLAYLDEDEAAIIDNNRVGTWLWMSRKEFESRWRARGGGWAVVFLAPPPPPYNGKPEHLVAAPGCICGDDCHCKPGKCPGGCPVLVGQCPNGRCPLQVPVSPLEVQGPPVGSVRIEGDWYQDDKFIYLLGRGALNPTTGEWADFNPLTRQYGAWAPRPPEGIKPPLPTGVDSSRITEAPRYSKNGHHITKREAHEALLDDSDRWHLAAVGDPAFLKRVRADYDKLPDELRAKLHLQLFSPAAWQVDTFNLSPGLTLRKPAKDRVSQDVGKVGLAEYAGITELLELPAGPTPKPTPAPEPRPVPVAPEPIPVIPVPMPPSDSKNPFDLLLGGIMAVVLYLVLNKKRSTNA